MTRIVQIDQLLKGYLKADKKIKGYSMENLTEPGENFGSRIYALEVRIESDGSDEETLHVVAKLYPINPWIEALVKSPITFKKEIGLYTVIAEEIRKIQHEHNLSDLLDLFPTYYGGRLSFNTEAKVGDKAAVILLENMRRSGFVTLDRLQGFDLRVAKLIVKNLAIFHAISIALKLKKPELFQEKIVPILVRAADTDPEDPNSTYNLGNFVEYLTTVMGEDEYLKNHIDRFLKYLNRKHGFFGSEELRQPFAAISHNDVWVNNILVRFENEEPAQVKLVDFQGIDYGSPVRDLILFLFTSVQKPVLEDNIDQLIDLHFKIIIETLDKFDIDREHKIFTRGEFEKEIEIEGQHQFIHVFILLTGIFRKRGTVKALEELKRDDLIFNPDFLTENFRPKILYFLSESIKRNWM